MRERKGREREERERREREREKRPRDRDASEQGRKRERGQEVTSFGADELQRAEDWQVRWLGVVLVTAALGERITGRDDDRREEEGLTSRSNVVRTCL